MNTIPTQGKENVGIMNVSTSPSFLKPKPIRLRKRPRPPPHPLNEVDPNSHAQRDFLLKSPKLMRNPFRRSEAKRKRELEDIEEDSNSLLWKHVNRALENSVVEVKTLPSPVVPSMLDECALSAFSDTLSNGLETKKVKPPENPVTKVLPVDWSLKTKVRFTSSAAFPNRGSFRTFEEVNGTIGFVRCLHPGETDKSSDVHSSLGAKFFQHCLVWTHPSLPWLNLFPRTQRSSGPPALSASAQEILHLKWCDSFRSLYQLVRLYQCPYFYMCSPSFTVLFRCAGAASIPVLHALISSTTKGFRKALRKEGIAFTMPLCKDSESSTDETLVDNFSTANENDGDKEDEDLADDDESWLESLGLSQDDFPSLNRKKRRSELSYKIDQRPESLVYVEDSETQALVNFLLNSHFCSDKIGPMAGVPPTLLAPVAFLGGTLQSLQMQHGKVKQGEQELDSVELCGPILPNTVHSLCSLFALTQQEFSAALSSHSPTDAFSQVQPHSPLLPCIFAKNNLTDCGLPDTFVQQMCSPSRPLRSLALDAGLFSFN